MLLAKTYAVLKNTVQNYRACKSGNFTMMFAIIMFLIIAIVGIAIDISRAVNVKSMAQASLDSAVLASTVSSKSQNTATMIDIEDFGKSYFREHFKPSVKGVMIEDIVISHDANIHEVIGSVTVSVANKFMFIFGQRTLPINVVSVAKGGSVQPPTDISIMLDISGSMAGAKLLGLNDAVTGFLDETIGVSNTSTTTRVAFAPFSSSVNAGSFENGLSGSLTPDRCVAERSGANAFTNALPNQDMFSVEGEFAISDDENGGAYRNAYFNGAPATPGFDMLSASTLCPDAEIFPLTGDYNQLKTRLDSYQAAGLTAGHIGIAYAWYLISEEWQSFWPLASQRGLNADTQKIAILMSDGQFNTYFQSANGEPNDQGRALCNNMKTAGVTIYSVSFDTSGSSEDLLNECASTPDKFFNTDTTAELSAAFYEIANGITENGVRLSQ